MVNDTEILALAIKIIMKNGCTTFDNCSGCPLCQYQGVRGVLGDLCCSIEGVK
jgi:hypothetical protein